MIPRACSAVVQGRATSQLQTTPTNNVAEYVAVINALKEAKRRGWEKDKITVYTDSQLVHGQIEAGKKVKAVHLITLNRKAVQLKSMFRSARLVWILGENNKVAHNAAKTAYLEWVLGQKNKQLG